jgi:ubiquinol-cytochrome c reductase cytochrome b subunit
MQTVGYAESHPGGGGGGRAGQPDWYMGWLEGAMRLIPSIQLHLFGYRVPEIVVPTLLLPLATFTMLYPWPAIDKRLGGDRLEHHLLDRPRDHPVRSAFGSAVLTFYIVLFIGGSQDVIAQKLGVSIEPVTMSLRVLVLALPALIAVITYLVCHDLARDKTLAEAQEDGEPPIPPAESPPAVHSRDASRDAEMVGHVHGSGPEAGM